jgi:hypothetical protein
MFLMNSNPNQTHSNFIRSKQDLPKLKNFEIEYGCQGFDVRNNFSYRNFLIFETGCEPKIREVF